MIVYQLACEREHYFEGWFASSQACERQAEAGQLRCPSCSSEFVRKLPSAPYVKGASHAAEPVGTQASRMRTEVLKALRKAILENTEDVGLRFAQVARRMHYEEEAARNIRGRVTPQEAAELQEEGVPAFAISPEVIPSEEVH